MATCGGERERLGIYGSALCEQQLHSTRKAALGRGLKWGARIRLVGVPRVDHGFRRAHGHPLISEEAGAEVVHTLIARKKKRGAADLVDGRGVRTAVEEH